MIDELLAFERRWLSHPAAGDGRKAQAIRDTFGVNETRHYQRLVAALETREAWETDPTTARLLRDRLSQRTRTR